MTDIKAADIAKALAKSVESEQESEYREKGLVGGAQEGDMVEAELKRVLIQRGDERVSTEVPEHELEILQAIYGPDNIEVLDVDAGVVQFPDDAGIELARLRQKYDRKDFQVIQQLYPRGAADLAASLGITDKGKSSESRQTASIKVRPPARKAAKKTASATKKTAR